MTEPGDIGNIWAFGEIQRTAMLVRDDWTKTVIRRTGRGRAG